MTKNIREVETIAWVEGLSIEEAALSFAQRKDLSKTAFCGPDRSYPASDAKGVRAGFKRLAQFGKELPRGVALSIYLRLVKKAKKYKVRHDTSLFEWLTGKSSVEESVAEAEEEDKKIRDWLYEEEGLNEDE